MPGPECVLSDWSLHQSSDFPLPSDLMVFGEVLLFWCRVLSGAVSSFEHGAAWRGIFSNVYFEAISPRCLCPSDSMPLHSFILCCVLSCTKRRRSVSSEAGRLFERFSLVASFNLAAVAPFSLVYSYYSVFLRPWFLPSVPCLSLWYLMLRLPPRPLPVLFDINIASTRPGGVGFRCGAEASSALLLPGYKQVSRGPWRPVTDAHMLIGRISRRWFPCSPPACTGLPVLWEMGSKNIDISLILESKACCS